ncbi:MAG: 30S ribosomal protein S7 [Planctomycetes bacterium]|nr:30S ribosomal protein S7 [Planctomycetota bacterium]NOG55629.1 30S ribosomal protein S7 [Planctomycetota bacterium]
MAGRITKSEDQLRPDSRFQNIVLAKFINCIMYDGKKSVATRVMYDALNMIQTRLEKENDENAPKTSIEVFERAISNVKPIVEVRSRRVGGANYQVPVQVSKRRQQSLAFRWIIQAARGDAGKPMHARLARELYDAARGEGKAMTTRENTHRMAEANKAFAHFAW